MNLFKQYKGLRKEIYVFFIGRIVTNLGSMIWPVLTLILNQKLGMNATQVALVTIISGIVVLPTGIIGGKLADKFNKRNIIIVCDLISIVFYIACAFIPISYLTIVILLIGSACQNMEGPAYNALVADLTTTKDREKAYSLSYLGNNIGLVASPTIAGLLFKNYLNLSFLISGVAIGISTVLIFFLVKDITPVVDDGADSVYQENREDASLWTILKENKLIFFYIIIMGVYWVAYGQYGYLMPLDMGEAHGEDGAAIYGTVSSLNCIIVVVFTPILTKLFEKVTHTKENLFGQMMLLVGYIVFVLFIGHIPFYYVAITLFTFGEILTTIANGPYLNNRIPASHRGRINGFQGILQNLLYGISMLVSGMLYDQEGSVVAWIYTMSLLAFSIIGSIGLVIWDRKRYKELY